MEELLEGTLEEAVEKLAAMAADLRTRTPTYSEKSAAVGDFLSSIGSAVNNNPELSHALIGGGIGAGIGGIGTALGNRGREPERRRGLLGSMMTGGLAGAGVGAGIGLARTGLSNLQQPGGAGGEGMGTDAIQAGQFRNPLTGQVMSIDPQALKNNPDLAKQVRQLTLPSTQSHIAGTIGGAWDAISDRAPTTSSLLPFTLGADAALHAPFQGLARTTADQVGGYHGNKWLESGIGEVGKVSDKMKEAVKGNQRLGTTKGTNLQLGDAQPQNWLASRTAGKDRDWLGRQAQKLKNPITRLNWELTGRKPVKPGVLDVLGQHANKGTGTDRVLTMKYPEMIPEEATMYREDPATGQLDRSTPRKSTSDVPTGKTKVETLNASQLGTAKRLGAAADTDFAGRSIFRLPGTNKVYRGSASLGGAVGWRALHGLPLGLEYLYRGLAEDSRNRQTLQQLMDQNSHPVPGAK